MNFVKSNYSILLIILVFFMSVALFSGCQTYDIVANDQIYIEGAATPFQIAKGHHQIVYGVSVDTMGRLIIQKFGIYYSDVTHIKIRQGLQAIIHLNEINHRNKLEINSILKRYHFNSLDDFIRHKLSINPITPNSQFVIIENDLGRNLFDVIQKATDWDNRMFRDHLGDNVHQWK